MATSYGGYMGKVLKVDLTTKEIGEYPWTDRERELYLGGKTMAAKIIADNIRGPIDPYSPENMLVFTTGPLTGSGAPSSSRWNVSTISPLTGLLTSSNCGGDFGINLKRAGYDGLVVVGAAESPVWLEITDERVIIHDASELWGLTTSEAQERMGDKKAGKAVIGPAGENLVRYASIISQERAAGRGGVGAVMGSKKLKGITAQGKLRVQSKNPDATKEINKRWVEFLKAHPITGRILPELGTANLVRRMERRGMLATRNFASGHWEEYELISGERLREYYLIKNAGCTTCPIRCARVVELEGKQVKGPELETLVLLGSNLLNPSLKTIMEWNHLLDELGMDTMSTGGCLALAMELNEKGLFSCGLEFGKVENIKEVIRDIAYRRGIGDILAEGTKRMAERFGGAEFAMHVKGLELAAYEPRGAVGHGLGYAVANRGGCHLNGGYMVFMEGLGLAMNNRTKRSKAALAVLMQDMLEAISAAGSCLFTSYAFIPGALLDDNKSLLSHCTNFILGISGPFVAFLTRYSSRIAPFHVPLLPHTKALEALTGMKMNFGKFLELGARGFNLERMVNLRLGLRAEHDRLPARLALEAQRTGLKRGPVPLEALKRQFYKRRGWDQKGRPEPSLLRRLGLEWLSS